MYFVIPGMHQYGTTVGKIHYVNIVLIVTVGKIWNLETHIYEIYVDLSLPLKSKVTKYVLYDIIPCIYGI